jgi:hypothetical protein
MRTVLAEFFGVIRNKLEARTIGIEHLAPNDNNVNQPT